MTWQQFVDALQWGAVDFGNTAEYNQARVFGAIALVRLLPQDIFEQIIARFDVQIFIDELNTDADADQITIRGM